METKTLRVVIAAIVLGIALMCCAAETLILNTATPGLKYHFSYETRNGVTMQRLTLKHGDKWLGSIFTWNSTERLTGDPWPGCKYFWVMDNGDAVEVDMQEFQRRIDIYKAAMKK